MKTYKLISIATLLTFIIGCQSTYQAKVDFDRNEKIQTSHYQKFAWLKEDKIVAFPDGLNMVMKVRIDDAIEQAFINKGYQLTEDAGQADFTISYSLGSRDKVKVDSFPASYHAGFGYGWGRSYLGRFGIGHETHTRSYTQGKLAIDVFDVKSKTPVWHGWAVKRIKTVDEDNPGRAIMPIVEQVVGKFN